MLDTLVKIIRDRKKSDITKSYTRKLLDKGIDGASINYKKNLTN